MADAIEAGGLRRRLPAVALSELLLDVAEENPGEVHPRFTEVLLRQRGIGGNYYSLAERAPGYLTDLRAKRFDEPERFFMGNALVLLRSVDAVSLFERLDNFDFCARDLAARLGIRAEREPFPHAAFVAETCREAPQATTHSMGFYVNSLGSWDDAVEIATAVLEDGSARAQGRDLGRMLEASGQALAVGAGDHRARLAWSRASAAFPDSFDRLLLSLRVATAEFKRFDDPTRTWEAVRTAEREARSLAASGHTWCDAEFAGALILNFRALMSLSSGDVASARREVDRAWRIMRELPNACLTLEPRVADRYRIMVLENRGLLSVRQERWGDAAGVFADAIELARMHEVDSLPEALSLFAAVRLRQGQALAARHTLEEAVSLLAAGTQPIAYGTVCRLLAVACDELREWEAAAVWLERAADHARATSPS